MEGIDLVVQSTQDHITWALSVLGGSIAAIIGTAYVSPTRRLLRSWYLLFVPGWILLSASIYYGDLVSRRHIATKFVADENVLMIVKAINSDYVMQQRLLFAAIVIFTIWLIGYLLWWIFCCSESR